ncbi:hypothetical protein ABN028_32725 [Actinopolymorpha sp. B17G11]|uniref:hypothetical protein n=1 Tax=Actinopolymorpha sp. B17G11 TaxID=3160861 RepID=UPI0032E439FA
MPVLVAPAVLPRFAPVDLPDRGQQAKTGAGASAGVGAGGGDRFHDPTIDVTTDNRGPENLPSKTIPKIPRSGRRRHRAGTGWP